MSHFKDVKVVQVGFYVSSTPLSLTNTPTHTPAHPHAHARIPHPHCGVRVYRTNGPRCTWLPGWATARRCRCCWTARRIPRRAIRCACVRECAGMGVGDWVLRCAGGGAGGWVGGVGCVACIRVYKHICISMYTYMHIDVYVFLYT